jgi:Icc-related predicted phosphoesterase
MRVQICSDLHLEFGRINKLHDKMVDTKADVLVLAGDITCGDSIVDDIHQIQQDSGKIVVFVPGNHEYYGRNRSSLDPEMLALESINPKVHVLIEKDFCLNGVCFLGSTGWWDGSNGPIGMAQKHSLNDFTRIYDLLDEGNLDGVVWGEKSRSYLAHRMHWLRQHMPDLKLCVITHHYPHHRSLDPRFAGSSLNRCFGNSWEWMFEKYHPEVWIHGHTHASFDYIVTSDNKKSRVVCNPQGYPEKYIINKERFSDHYDIVSTDADNIIYLTKENNAYDPQKTINL